MIATASSSVVATTVAIINIYVDIAIDVHICVSICIHICVSIHVGIVVSIYVRIVNISIAPINAGLGAATSYMTATTTLRSGIRREWQQHHKETWKHNSDNFLHGIVLFTYQLLLVAGRSLRRQNDLLRARRRIEFKCGLIERGRQVPGKN